MKSVAWAVLFVVVTSWAGAESLADAARRERERREKNKTEGVEAKVVDSDELARTQTKKGKGTVNYGTAGDGSGPGPTSVYTGSSSSSSSMPSSASKSPESSSSKGYDSANPELEGKRRQAHADLEAYYQQISSVADKLVTDVDQYLKGCAKTASEHCSRLSDEIGHNAVYVANAMEKAEEAARVGWLQPGDVTAMRTKYGMDDGSWDRLVRIVQKYRRR